MALVGATWQVASRHAVTTSLGPLELAVLRYVGPSLLLLPLAYKTGLFPSGLGKGRLALIVLGGGLPFGMLAFAGAQFAPVMHMGVLLPGTMPLFVALGAWGVFGDQLGRTRMAGFAIIFAGIATVVGSSFGADTITSGAWRGDLIFLVAAVFWAAYTLALRDAGLTPWQSVALVNAWSASLLLPLVLLLGVPKFHTASWHDIAVQVLAQSLLAGLAGLVLYSVAIRHLGAARAALSGAVVPLLSAAGGWLLLRESPGVTGVVAVAAVCAGIVLAGSLGRSAQAK